MAHGEDLRLISTFPQIGNRAKDVERFHISWAYIISAASAVPAKIKKKRVVTALHEESRAGKHIGTIAVNSVCHNYRPASRGVCRNVPSREANSVERQERNVFGVQAKVLWLRP